jgi:RTX calcium-binding nonapeptide repeat (4 copies)
MRNTKVAEIRVAAWRHKRRLRDCASFAAVVLAAIVIACPAFALSIGGTNGDDTLRGTSGPDRINGKAGADEIYGLGGSDVLVGGSGRDYLVGGSGSDLLETRDGTRDSVDCGPGRDRVVADRSDIVSATCEVVLRPPAPPSTPPKAACSNGQDDDGDGRTDYPADPGCSSASDEDETDPRPAPVEVATGFYKGTTQHGNFVFFGILPQRRVSGFRVNDVRQACDDGYHYIYGSVDVGNYSTPIDDAGKFGIEWEYDGVIVWDDNGDRTPAHFHFRIAGIVRGAAASGVILGTTEFERDGRHYRCSNSNETWTAALLP